MPAGALPRASGTKRVVIMIKRLPGVSAPGRPGGERFSHEERREMGTLAAAAATGGSRLLEESSGWWCRCNGLDNVSPAMAVAREEIFCLAPSGPILLPAAAGVP